MVEDLRRPGGPNRDNILVATESRYIDPPHPARVGEVLDIPLHRFLKPSPRDEGVVVGPRELPQTADPELVRILPMVAADLFYEILRHPRRVVVGDLDRRPHVLEGVEGFVEEAGPPDRVPD